MRSFQMKTDASVAVEKRMWREALLKSHRSDASLSQIYKLIQHVEILQKFELSRRVLSFRDST